MVISGRYDQVFMARYAEENRLKGLQEGVIEGECRARHNIAVNMLRAGEPVEKIAACCSLGEDEVRSLEEGMLAGV